MAEITIREPESDVCLSQSRVISTGRHPHGMISMAMMASIDTLTHRWYVKLGAPLVSLTLIQKSGDTQANRMRPTDVKKCPQPKRRPSPLVKKLSAMGPKTMFQMQSMMRSATAMELANAGSKPCASMRQAKMTPGTMMFQPPPMRSIMP